MTDAVQIALIVSAAPTMGTVGAIILGFLNRNKISEVATKVDGHLTEMKTELKDATKAVLELTGSDQHKAGQLQETQEARERPK